MPKTIRVTFVCRSENLSGGQRVIAIYADRLTKRGYDVTVVLPKRMAQSFRTRARTFVNQGIWFGGATRNEPSYFRNASFKIRRLSHSGPVTDRDVPDADVIIASWWETAEWVAELGPSKGVKVYFIQGHEVHDHLPVPRSEATYRLPLHKIVVAPWLKGVMIKQYGDSTVDVVPNSVDRTQFFAVPRGKRPVPTVGFLYSTTPLKRLDLTFSALRIVQERIPQLRTVTFGSTFPLPSLAPPKGTQFFRLPPQDEIRNIYAGCDAWITASRSEGFNLPALEAMACRTPVVSTRTGWPQDMVKSGWNGVLADIDDVSGLAKGVEWILSLSDDEWRTLSANAYATASAGSWEESTIMFEKALEHACLRAVRGELIAVS